MASPEHDRASPSAEDALAALGSLVGALAKDVEASGCLAGLKSASDALGGAAGLRPHVRRACEATHQLLLRAEAERAEDKGNNREGGAAEGGPGVRMGRSERMRARANAGLQVLFYLQQALGAAELVGRLVRETAPILAFEDGDDEDGADGGGGAVAVPEVKDDELVAGIARFSGMDLEDANKSQQLILYLLTCAQERGYRRGPSADGAAADLYHRIASPRGGHDTHAWERACSIRDFVYDMTRKEVKYDMWLALTGVRGSISSVVEHLAHCHDVQVGAARPRAHPGRGSP